MYTPLFYKEELEPTSLFLWCLKDADIGSGRTLALKHVKF